MKKEIKYLIYPIVLILTCPVFGFDCHTQVAQNKKALTALNFLQTIAGYYKGPDCQISISVCGEINDNAAPSTVIGEILVVDGKGRELYLPLDFQILPTNQIKSSILNGSRMFHFEYSDYNPAPPLKAYELYLFEAVKTPDKSKLEYVEFGIIGPNDKRVYWAVCKDLNKI